MLAPPPGYVCLCMVKTYAFTGSIDQYISTSSAENLHHLSVEMSPSFIRKVLSVLTQFIQKCTVFSFVIT